MGMMLCMSLVLLGYTQPLELLLLLAPLGASPALQTWPQYLAAVVEHRLLQLRLLAHVRPAQCHTPDAAAAAAHSTPAMHARSPIALLVYTHPNASLHHPALPLMLPPPCLYHLSHCKPAADLAAQL
jgi:hypothetical protein